MKERLELVRQWGDLRDGMLVVVKRCGRCGRDHRGVLLNFEKAAPCMATNGQVTTEDTWEVVPNGSCGCAYIGKYDVEVHQCVYRVIDGLEDPAHYTDTISVDEQLAKVRAHQWRKERAR